METSTKPTTFDIKELFGRAYSSSRDIPKFLTDDERAILGAKIFKRMTLGLCGTSTVKSIDEIASIMWKLKMVDTLDEGKNLIPSLYETTVPYTGLSYKLLEFNKVKDVKGNEAFRISALNYDL